MQHPIEVPGVSLAKALTAARPALPDGAAGTESGGMRERLHEEARRIGFEERFLDRPLNVDLSGGERKRNETLQLGVLRPRFAVLDEIDSGLDIDALGAVGRRVQEATTEWDLGVLAITHFRRLLEVLHPDVVHVLADGRVVATGGSDLAEIVDRTGYAAYH
jgi:Fe-S cluster assembly ATP-binding protein